MWSFIFPNELTSLILNIVWVNKNQPIRHRPISHFFKSWIKKTTSKHALAYTLHIIFIVTWFSGMFYIVRLFIYNTEAQSKPEPAKEILTEQFSIMIKRLWLGITWPSAILTLIFGGWMASYFMPVPTWLWIKICFVVLLYVYHLPFIKFTANSWKVYSASVPINCVSGTKSRRCCWLRSWCWWPSNKIWVGFGVSSGCCYLPRCWWLPSKFTNWFGLKKNCNIIELMWWP